MHSLQKAQIENVGGLLLTFLRLAGSMIAHVLPDLRRFGKCFWRMHSLRKAQIEHFGCILLSFLWLAGSMIAHVLPDVVLGPWMHVF